jgi:hypothetical protein
VSQKSKLADAIRYALSRWAGLSLFLDDGRVELDTNAVERSMRPLALTRKERAVRRLGRGRRALGRGRLAGRNLQAERASSRTGYLADVIARIVSGHPQSRLDDLLPWAYPTTPALKAVA